MLVLGLMSDTNVVYLKISTINFLYLWFTQSVSCPIAAAAAFLRIFFRSLDSGNVMYIIRLTAKNIVFFKSLSVS